VKQVRVVPIILFALLTIVSVQAALASPPNSTVADAPASLEMTSLEGFLCNLSRVSSAELPGSDPAPIQATGETCGGCSTAGCANKVVGSRCVVPITGGWAWCLPPTTFTCGGDPRPFCDCLKEYP
jgi:hypothetical protein